MSNKKDYATSTVLTAPSPADSGTSLVVQSGHGARFPSTPFYVTAHPPSEFPTLDNAEKLLVTAKSTDTFTITRAQGDTTAQLIEAGWRISNAVFLADFPATFDDLTDGSTNKAYTSTEKTKLSGIATGADVTSDAITAATGKTTPVDADTMPLSDSAASNVMKKVTWANIKATVKAYLDSFYQPVDTDLTTIAGLTATTDNFLQSKSSAWASRTVAQVKTDLGLTGTNSGDQTTIAGITGTTAQFNTALTDNDFATLAGTENLTNKTFDSTSPSAFFYPGFLVDTPRRTAPTGWLMCDGSAVSRSTYAGLFAAICEDMGAFTVTIATPGVFTLNSHGLNVGDSVYLTTTGALPTGLTANTLYYVSTGVTTNTFSLSTTRANAYAGTKIATTGSQSGVHNLRWCPFGLGDGSTTFTLPDFRGRTRAGADAMGGTAASRLTLADALGSYGNPGASGGEQRHTMVTAEMVAHSHTIRSSDNGYIVAYTASYAAGSNGGYNRNVGTSDNIGNTSTVGSTTPFNLISPTGVVNVIIKT